MSFFPLFKKQEKQKHIKNYEPEQTCISAKSEWLLNVNNSPLTTIMQ